MPETVACNLCGIADGVPQPWKARFLRIPQPFGIYRCRRCGLTYQNPRPTPSELAAIYATHPYYSTANVTRGEPRQRFYASRMERLERRRPQRGTMLGMGCLDGGYALEVAQRRGWRVSAIEFSPILAAHAREQLGVEVEVAEAWDLSSVAGRRFDVIYSRSLEHFLDPRATLRHCWKLVAHEGLLMLDVPNTFHSLKDKIKRPIVALMGSKAIPSSHGEFPSEVHTYYFDPRTIRRLLEGERFEVLELRTYLPHNPVYLANPRLRWLQELLYAVGGLFDRGPSIEVIARPVRW
ncbi:MAG: class I SAM-dependent methyltransferase [Candidatus Methylomirabilis oxyfera]|nr:class I SAM-dependent methyltransferase [Candidatus Methylomirabilis oxyfera]